MISDLLLWEMFPRLSPLYVTLGSILRSAHLFIWHYLVAVDCLSGYLMTRRVTCSPICSPTPPLFFFCQQMHFVFQSDCGCRWIKSFRKQTRVFQPHKDFLLFCRECTFSPLISKVSRRVSTLHNSFFLSTALRRRSFTSPNRICAGAQLCQSSFVKVHRSLKSIVLLYPIQL